MVRYSVQPRNWIFVKMYFAKNMGKSISKNLSCKYSQELLDHSKYSAMDALKTSSRIVSQRQQK